MDLKLLLRGNIMEIKCGEATVVMTTGEFAEKHKVEYAIAMGFLKFMMVAGVVKEAGKRPAAGGKGKPSTLYTIPLSVQLDFTK
jgi:hypothetical protein